MAGQRLRRGRPALGPMTRTVRDAALMFSAMARYDLRDPFCLPGRSARLARRHRGRRRRACAVGVLRRPGFDAPVDADGIAAVERAAQSWPTPAPMVEEADADLPDTSS